MSDWILLRGLMRESRHWHGFPAVLQGALPEARITALDLPGNGSLHLMDSPSRVEDMTESCRGLLRERGIAPPYHLLALSLGGMVATVWRARYPQELAACVLLNTSMRPFNAFYDRLRPRSYPALIRLPFLSNALLTRERLILQLTSNRPEAQRAVLNACIQIQRDAPVSRRNALRQLHAAMRYRADAHRSTVPTLLLSSRADGLVACACSERIALAWDCALQLHPDAGHDLTLDDPQWVASRIAEWVATWR